MAVCDNYWLSEETSEVEYICPGAFSVAGPSVWNSLPDYLRDPAVSRNTFCKHLKSFLFAVY